MDGPVGVTGCRYFVLNDTATTEIYTLSLHDALPISPVVTGELAGPPGSPTVLLYAHYDVQPAPAEQGWLSDPWKTITRSEEHTSELQSRQYLVCRLLLEKKTQLS